MNLFKYLSLLIFLTIISSLITDFVRRFSIKNKLLDIPNDRSSHDIPKPKGGGISIVLIILGTVAVLSFFGMIKPDISMSMLVGLSIVAVVGLIDDYKDLSILVRTIFYFIAAVFSIYLIGGITSISISDYYFDLNHIGFFLGVLFLVWTTNLYNFMDGTDGFAAIQTICIGLFCGLLLYLIAETSYAIIMFCLVASTIGFLHWNWAPAKIFMGDVGSCTIGFLFGLLSLYMEKMGIISIAVWLVLLSPFIVDSTFTLLKRIINKEKWYTAHNMHAFQKLYQSGLAHNKLAIGLLVMNITIVWPIAWLAHVYKNLESILLVSLYGIIGIMWLIVQSKCKQTKTILS